MHIAASKEKKNRLTVSHFSAMVDGGDGGGGRGAADECCGREVGL